MSTETTSQTNIVNDVDFSEIAEMTTEEKRKLLIMWENQKITN